MTADDEALDEQDVFHYYFGRIPTADEIRALQSRFGMTHVPRYLIRRQIVQAATFYFEHRNPPTPNAKAKRYCDVVKKTNALLRTLGKGVDYDMLNVEPPGIRHMLYRMRENAERELAAIQPEVAPGKKQRRKTRKGIRSFICSLADMLNWFDAPPMSVYTYTPSTDRYSGAFFELAETACRMTGIKIANQNTRVPHQGTARRW